MTVENKIKLTAVSKEDIKIFAINRLHFVLMTVLLLRAATDHIMLTAGFIFGPLLVYYCMGVYFPQRYSKFRFS